MKFIQRFRKYGANTKFIDFCNSATAESRAKIWYQWDAFRPPVAWVAVRSGAVVLLFLSFCLLLLPFWESVIALCFVVRHFMSILVLQSS